MLEVLVFHQATHKAATCIQNLHPFVVSITRVTSLGLIITFFLERSKDTLRYKHHGCSAI